MVLLTGRSTEWDIKTQYRIFSIIYHPDKNDPESTGMKLNQVEEYFKNVNNAYKYIRSQLWKFPHFWRK